MYLEQLKQDILDTENRLVIMKSKLEGYKSLGIEYSNSFYKVNSASIEKRDRLNTVTKSTLEHARYRDTKEQAEETLLRELQANRIEALARKIDPDWKTKHSHLVLLQEKYIICKDTHRNMYDYCLVTESIEYLGTPYMSKTTAKTICTYLNEGLYSLDMEE